MARILKTEENEKLTWQDMKYGEKHWKTGKKKHKLQDVEYSEKKLKNVKYEKYTLQDLDFD